MDMKWGLNDEKYHMRRYYCIYELQKAVPDLVI